MRVAHIGAGRYGGDVGATSTFRVWRSLAAKCDAYLVCGRASGRSRRLNSQGIDIRLIFSFARSELEFFFTQFLFVFALLRFKPDVVLAQCPVKGGIVGLLMKTLTGCRLVVEFHGNEYFESPPGSFKTRCLQYASRWVVQRADQIRCLSAGMRRRCVEAYGSPIAGRIRIVPIRVDLASFNFVKTSWGIQGKPKLVMVGTLNDNKGQLRAIRGALSDFGPVELWLFGDGPDYREIEGERLRLGSSVEIKMYGLVGHETLGKLLPKADIFLLFSKTEATPRALAEAMAVGLPVIATDVGFCRDIIQDGIEGIILSEVSNEQLLRALRSLVGSEELRAALGSAAARRAREQYDSLKVYPKYFSLLQSESTDS